MSARATVHVLAFGSAVDALGWTRRDVLIEPGDTVASVLSQLEAESSRLAAARQRLRFAINQRYAELSATLAAGDELAIIPPVSGGAEPAARLVREVIDPLALIREVENAAVGAIASFFGTVRYETRGEGVGLRALEYTAYDAMALSDMARLCSLAAQEHEIYKAVLVHRLGVLKIGDISVAVVVSAAHRAAAFDACRMLIEAVKKSTPIFKRELWHDGRQDWVDGV
ncbi:MAG: hypothetical protein CHACPFDD_00462 [Phycisphaerae bacterium]|nr:hypothetical protein [Phycisphaerae bacterium]